MVQSAERLRQPVVVVLGHTDAGKCISSDAMIHLANGDSICAEEAFNLYHDSIIMDDGGEILCRAKDLHLLSIDRYGRLSPRAVSYLWKRNADLLIRVRTKQGNEIKTTPMHRFLVYDESIGLSYIRADMLRVGDMLVVTKGYGDYELMSNRLSYSINSFIGAIIEGFNYQHTIYAQRPDLSNDLCLAYVNEVSELQGSFTVYDFTVNDTHNFIANGFIVHNTSLLDKMRGTAVQAREAGGITQEIGASFFPIETLKEICGPLLERARAEIRIPGLLIIDTPGHEVFSNLRIRGGSAADIAIVVIDVLKGLENQTVESIDILKKRKVPFLVALNKIDMIKGWKKDSKGFLSDVLKEQYPEWNDEFEERLYNVIGGLSRLGFESEVYYRVKDFRRQVSIVPVSARYGIGIPELLAVLVGLAQRYLENKLSIAGEQGAKGIILELQEEIGVGLTANLILTEGTLKVGDSIILVKRDGVVKSRVKALFMPKPLDEMRDPRDKFTPVSEVVAAAGVKLVSPDLQGVIPGTLIATFKSEDEFERLRVEAEKDIERIIIRSDKVGVIVKAGSIGALEALLKMLNERSIPVRLADIGDISKNDIIEADAVKERDPYLAVILGFDVKLLPEAREFSRDVPMIISNVIYEVVENYISWAEKKREEDERAALSALTIPAKLKVIPGTFFRRSDPAIFGVEVLAGKIRPKLRLMDENGKELGMIEQIQDRGKSIENAKMGDKVAISVHGPTLGRQIKENDIIYTFPRSHEVKLLKSKFLNALSADDLSALEEIVRIRSAHDPMYGF